MNSDQNKSRIVPLAAGIIILFILIFVLRQLESFLKPLFIAVFFFYISEPIIQFLKKKRVPPIITHFVPLFLVVVVLCTVGWIVGAHVDDLAAQFPEYKDKIQALYQSGVVWFAAHAPVLGDRLKGLLTGVRIPLAPFQKIINALVGNVFGFLSFSLLVVFFLVFIMQEAVSLPKRIEAAYGLRRCDKILAVWRRINGGIIQYIYIKGLASLAVAFLSTVAMLGFGLELAVFWGTLIFFGNFIPYIGSAVAVLLPIVFALLEFSSIGPVVALALILIAFQILVGNFLEPKFAGQQLNLSPLVVLLSLAFWGWLWGIVGLILSIPIMVSVKIVLENIPSTHEVAILISHVNKTRDGKK